MSYDVSLYIPRETETCYRCPCGAEHQTPAEAEVFHANYTSNCSPMWDAAGCRLREWAYEKAEGRTASTLIEPLETAIATMVADPQRFIAMNPDNGWGSYETVIPFLRSILSACRAYPEARVYVSN